MSEVRSIRALPLLDAVEVAVSAVEATGTPQGSGAGRVPPNELDAEAAVLSAVLLDADAFDRVQETLAPEHFYADANRRIYEAVLDLKSMSGQPVDVVSVAAWLRDRNRLAQIGGTPYLAQLTDATPAIAHVENHARMIREKWRLRQLIATCQRVTAEGYAGCEDVQGFIDSGGASRVRHRARPRDVIDHFGERRRAPGVQHPDGDESPRRWRHRYRDGVSRARSDVLGPAPR